MAKKNSRLVKILKKKAAGYESVEKVEEFQLIDGELCLTKRKITTKENPPDINAIKLLLGFSDDDDYSGLNLAELEKERERLIGLLKEDG